LVKVITAGEKLWIENDRSGASWQTLLSVHWHRIGRRMARKQSNGNEDEKYAMSNRPASPEIKTEN
jgi:hypothetical protein